MITSRNLNDLHPDLVGPATRAKAACAAQGVDIIETCTYRDNAAQAALYAQGRTAPGAIVTHAKPGQSYHNRTNAAGAPASQAVDVVPVRNGKCVWDASDPAWDIVVAAYKAEGFDWGGDWVGFTEKPHFQMEVNDHG
jgi:peptidoglycan L-alanyl-D-glutamate endopeptidase CwlK